MYGNDILYDEYCEKDSLEFSHGKIGNIDLDIDKFLNPCITKDIHIRTTITNYAIYITRCFRGNCILIINYTQNSITIYCILIHMPTQLYEGRIHHDHLSDIIMANIDLCH